MGYFGIRVQRMFWCFLMWTNDFHFPSSSLFLIYHVVLSWCGRWFGCGSQQLRSLNPNYSYVCFVVGVGVAVRL